MFSMKKIIKNIKRCFTNLDICLDEMGKNLPYLCDRALDNELVTDELVVGMQGENGISNFGNAVFYSQEYYEEMTMESKVYEFKKALEKYTGVKYIYEES